MLPLVPRAGSSSSVTSTAVNPDMDFATKATAIAEHLQPSFILQHIACVYSLYHNIVALGPSDERIWEYIDMCWENFSVTIARANGREIEIEFGYEE
ncbi:uncharacterized protein STEHIDRAFT_164197 [Stereum hirsutum FP-91666 SS1]|uniref:Uncharacterized protein n=1 Tax=Stereum hirsutum (strain FP-91666) TaxID=721885 RepID=R7RVD5_STEHR|nr:uncharacterized protein STEHIDRAFT_164197 [Stereum hirsutum FP-91666 SS1]EIM78921.1 hypothetical protein STEHIDRAFT_164197 [Stereum hirsutum FP-91666 SS1]